MLPACDMPRDTTPRIEERSEYRVAYWECPIDIESYTFERESAPSLQCQTEQGIVISLISTGQEKRNTPERQSTRPIAVVVPQVEDLEQTFNELATKWKAETRTQSAISAIVMHPAYLAIIGMGPDVIRLVFRELQRENDLWFTALRALTQASPVKPEDAGNLKKMRQAWLRWGNEHGYLD